MRRGWWWVGLSVLACSVPMQDYGRLYARARCEREQRCGHIAKAIDCSRPDLFAETFPEQPLLAAGAVTYSPADAAACLQRFRETNCATDVELMPECRRAFPGTLGDGAPCSDRSRTCAPGLICFAGSSSCGTCVSATGEGQVEHFGHPCDVGLIGATDGGLPIDLTCIRRRELGERCERGVQCQPWLLCAAGVCAYPQPALILDGGGLRELGEPCGRGQVPCQVGLRCAAERCTLLLNNGADCAESADCMSSRCFDARCSARVVAGGTCNAEEDCAQELHCIDGRCDTGTRCP